VGRYRSFRWRLILFRARFGLSSGESGCLKIGSDALWAGPGYPTEGPRHHGAVTSLPIERSAGPKVVACGHGEEHAGQKYRDNGRRVMQVAQRVTHVGRRATYVAQRVTHVAQRVTHVGRRADQVARRVDRVTRRVERGDEKDVLPLQREEHVDQKAEGSTGVGPP